MNLTAETFVWRYGGVFCPVALGEAKGGRLSWAPGARLIWPVGVWQSQEDALK